MNAPQPNKLADVCATLLSEQGGRLLVVGGSTPDDGGLPDSVLRAIDAPAVRADGPDAVGELADAAGAERYSLGLVFPGPATGGDAAGLSQLLASLRDRYARRVLVSDSAGLMALSDYLALGFERLEGDGLESLYLFDPDAESRQREWNNPRNWANPENFDRYRW